MEVDASNILRGRLGHGPGSGSALDPGILILAGVSALIATGLSTFSILLHLKNYRRPMLQRQVIRIMLMIPIYAISSFISLFSLEAAVVIDAIRDVYEAFVIYNFFHLLLDYLGGERSLLILLHGRPPKHHVFPVSIFKSEIDVSDPFTFLFLKRGILQYVQVKPVLAVVTLILKATNTYKEGDFRADAGYLYVSIIYNISICIALYCLAMFWVVINDDVKPFRPMPKFLCIKGILFFCFWQTIVISILVSPLHVITHVGPYTDTEHISIAISDVLICLEMPFFAVAHMYAFSHTDYIDRLVHYAARMRFWYATRDAFGLLDVVEDSKATLNATVSYRTYEPVEGGIHVGAGRDRRIRAGLRYAEGGTKKYWLPMPEDDELVAPAVTGPLASLQRRWDEYRGYAPLPAEEAAEVVHEGFQEPDPNAPGQSRSDPFRPDYMATDEDDLDLHFDSPDDQDNVEVEELYQESRKFIFGDYNYPVIDVSTETAKVAMWDEEERILRNERNAAWMWKGGKNKTPAYAPQPSQPIAGSRTKSYGATGDNTRSRASGSGSRELPNDVPHPAVIDYAHDTVPDIDIKGIRLGWTKTGAPKITKKPSDRSTAPPTSHRDSSSSSQFHQQSKHKSKERPTSTDAQPEHVSDPEASDQEPVDTRDDAVDLVVEDRHAGELEMEWERRRGEPALAGESGLKKVYRRKYDVGKDEEEGEDTKVEIEEARHHGEEPDELPERVRMKITSPTSATSRDKASDSNSRLDSPGGRFSPWNQDNRRGKSSDLYSPGTDAEVVITRATTPPPHARLEVKATPSPSVSPSAPRKYSPYDEEDTNPWD